MKQGDALSLPKGWEIKKLGDVIEIRNGKNQQQVLSETGQYPIMGSAGNIMGYSTDYICEAGTTIIGRKGNINKPLFINERFWNVDTAFGFYPKNENEVDKKLIYFLCLNIDFGKMNRGTTIPSLVKSELQKIEFPLPSLPEQQRIVAILDEAFAAIAKAKTNAEQNLKNAKDLFESYLHGVFDNKDESWEEKTIDTIIESNIIGLTKNSSEQRSDYEYKYVKMNNITRDNRFDLTKYTCVNATKLEAEKYSLSEGDFLFNTRNSYELVGKTCLFEGYEDEVILYNNNIMRIRFIKSVNSHFINYSFTTKDIIKKLDEIKSGTTNVSAIYYKDLKNLKLLIPPINQQKAIVQKLDALSLETKKLEGIYQKKIADLEELKKSVLQKAFAGELKEKLVTV